MGTAPGRAVLERAGLEPAERNALIALAHCRGDVERALVFLRRRGDYQGEGSPGRDSGPRAREFRATIASAREKIARAAAAPPPREEPERPRTFRPGQTQPEEDDVERRELVQSVLERAREPLTIEEVTQRIGDGRYAATRSLVMSMASVGALKRFGKKHIRGHAGAPPTLFGLPEWPVSDYAPGQPAPRRHVGTSPPPEPPPAPSPPVGSAPPAAEGPDSSRKRHPDPEPPSPVTPSSGAGAAAGTPPAEGSGADSPPLAPPAAEGTPPAAPPRAALPPALHAFLYLLMRDGLPFGQVRSLLDQAVESVQRSGGKLPDFTAHEVEMLARRYGEALIGGKALLDL